MAQLNSTYEFPLWRTLVDSALWAIPAVKFIGLVAGLTTVLLMCWDCCVMAVARAWCATFNLVRSRSWWSCS